MSGVSSYDLRYLGGVSLVRGGTPVALRSRRTTALLARLAIAAEPLSRTHLADMFWPEADEARSRGNLRVLLSSLRHVAGPLLLIQRESVALATEARDRVDVHRFDRLADRAEGAATDVDRAAEDALGEYAGELLTGLDLDDAPAFEQWVVAERTRLHLRAVHLLERLVDRQLPLATSRTIVLAHRLCDLDPLRESSHERLVQAQWRAGDRAGALASHAAWERLAADELGLPVSDPLQAVAERIRRGDHPPRAPMPVPVVVAPDATAEPEALFELAAEGNARNRPHEVEATLAPRHHLLDHDDVAVARTYLFHRYRALHLGLGRHEAMLAVLDRAARGRHGADMASIIAAYRAQVLRDTGDATGALRLCEQVLHAEVADAPALQLVEGTVFLACFDLGRTGHARELAQRVRQRQGAGRAVGIRHADLWARLHELACLLTEGRVTDAIVALEPFRRHVLDSPERSQRGVVGGFLGHALLRRGAVADALPVLVDAQVALQDADVLGMRAQTLALLGQAQAMTGDVDAARRTQAEAHAHGGGRYRTRFAVETASLDAWVEAAEGRRDTAAAVAGSQADRADGRPGVEIPLRHLAMTFGASPAPIADRLEQLVPATDNPLLARHASHARALAEGDEPALREAAEGYATDGAWYDAAITHGQADAAAPSAGVGGDLAAVYLDRCVGLGRNVLGTPD